ncbi:MAG: hypothetical protein VCE75_02120, partial [Alphaproteobacteria bacterium]
NRTLNSCTIQEVHPMSDVYIIGSFSMRFQNWPEKSFTVLAAAFVRAILAFTILAGHGWSYVKYLLVDY